jgi:hypothetical protein
MAQIVYDSSSDDDDTYGPTTIQIRRNRQIDRARQAQNSIDYDRHRYRRQLLEYDDDIDTDVTAVSPPIICGYKFNCVATPFSTIVDVDETDVRIQSGCGICFTEPCSVMTSCKHAYCRNCIFMWISKNASNATCPMCRSNITASSCATIAIIIDNESDTDECM